MRRSPGRGRLLAGSAALAALVLGTAASAQVGEMPPQMKAVRWYETPPLALEQLRGKAVMIEVFRTW